MSGHHMQIARALTLLIKVWGVLHILATALFLLPQNPATAFYAPAVNTYMIPLFNQDWHLFSPRPPTSSLHYWIRCSADQEGLSQSPWIDPLAREKGVHKALRVVGHGRAKRFEEYVVAEIWAQALERKSWATTTESSSGALSLLKLEHGGLLATKALNSCRRAYDSAKISQVQIQIAQSFAKNWSEVGNSADRKPSFQAPRGVSLVFEPISADEISK